MTRKFTGRHITVILVSFFGVVMAVNFTMAFLASSTFGGLVVQNSYVASQEFNKWLAQARAENALGWALTLNRTAETRLSATLRSANAPMNDVALTATARHPLGRKPDIALQFRALGDGVYESLQPLPQGRWIVHVRARAHGREINRVVDLS
ncbi:nitrogen fixation protein FixH [Sphingobium sp. B2D3A]|uniref:FixH family protein n=1 Tax=unclassified Sphingobium TaxID=2611147 RepID=UPI0022255F32|nr:MULTISPECIES: FixH family protein [unclassified Sphingobium]MCW2337642.1 nitrogen fixation protein FixH [Sphingobium sp. B2D3A]MCW2350727.1 nitrogen fixation protein FixH [Sphingobium sp. B12D2B]MCW2366061.1 nitrogen fixation protein FixH [Sphingobium sp. B7D2B]MCW2369830.1 nitrogen fixation protein FixH [Sphingobium sp. B11D3D]MCW2384100.1 nitrogen fixation protein FixH [Sphingobium sp. B2D3D]